MRYFHFQTRRRKEWVGYALIADANMVLKKICMIQSKKIIFVLTADVGLFINEVRK